MMRETKIASIDNNFQSKTLADMVFIHGIDGSSTQTWTHPTTNFFLPKEISEVCSEIQAWTLEYDASATTWQGNAVSLFDRASNVITALEAEGFGNRPCIFACHSYGGLLIKQIFRLSLTFGNPDWRRISQSTQGIIFFSTPHVGSHVVDYLKKMHFILNLSPSTISLNQNSAELRELNIWFREILSHRALHILNFVETRPTKWGVIVDESSADPGIVGSVPRPIDADHFSICKPESKDNLTFKACLQFTQSLLSGKMTETRIRRDWRIKVGDRILSYWIDDDYYYPSIVLEISERYVVVEFHDGRKKRLPRSQIKQFVFPDNYVEAILADDENYEVCFVREHLGELLTVSPRKSSENYFEISADNVRVPNLG